MFTGYANQPLFKNARDASIVLAGPATAIHTESAGTTFTPTVPDGQRPAYRFM